MARDVYALIAARRAELDRLAGYFEWAASRPVAEAGRTGAELRGYRAMCKIAARMLREMPVGPSDRLIVAALERWERLCQRRMDAEGFSACDRAEVPSRLWFASGAAQAARDAVAVVRSGSADIRAWDRLPADRELGWELAERAWARAGRAA